MLLLKKGFPEEQELLLCTVKSVHHHSVFVKLDEYDKTGLIHISEIAPGRIRNIRDYVAEGKKVVCLVLRINKEKGHIDLSLRRVNESQKRAKLDEIKKEQKSEKILETIAKKLNKGTIVMFKDVSDKILKKYDTLYSCFEELSTGDVKLEDLGVEKDIAEALTESVKERIKPAEFQIKGQLKLATYLPEGVELIKDVLKKAEKEGKGKLSITYWGGGRYKFISKSDSYKGAESIINKSVKIVSESFKKSGECEFKIEK